SDEVYSKWSARYVTGDVTTNGDNAEAPRQTTAQKNDRITGLLKLRLNSDKVSEPVNTPVAGIFQPQFGKRIAYLSSNGRYLFMADLIDLEQEQNLTNNAKRKIATPAPKPISNEVTGNAKTRKMTDLLELRLGSKAIAEPVETPIGGIYQARFGVNYAYLTENGRYALIGNLIDLERGQNLTNLARQKIALDAIAQFPLEARAVFPASGEEKAVLNIFTDTSCAFCQKLHGEIANLQAAGISVHYLPYPREGTQGPGYRTLKQVWCASDRANAMTIAKGQVQGDLPVGDCTSAGLVDQGYALGNSVGISGTPALFKSNGEMIQGYVPSQQLIQQVLGN
ncbi:MAG: thioredoxin fold domain-containing protein, partial [Gammaproteobacteria bacterium]|nr:thioredoxin fold domain-containing protein [Gammaproteobacteria bacterium]